MSDPLWRPPSIIMLNSIFRLGVRYIKASGSKAVLRPSFTLKATVSIARRIASMRPLGTLGTLSCYTLFVAFFLGIADLEYARRVFPAVQPTSAGTVGLINRIAWYKDHSSDYNLVFLGDSRTYCGVHGELLDPILGTSSINLASFSNWFPTQYSFARDLVPLLPAGTTVVWSIGPENFRLSPIQRVYPVGIWNAIRFLFTGVPTNGLADNVFFYNPALYFLTQRGDIHQSFINFMERKVHTEVRAPANSRIASPSITQSPSYNVSMTSRIGDQDDVLTMRAQWENDPRVAYVAEEHSEGELTSLTVYFKRGSYYRIEIDHAFFRRKQQELGASFQRAIPQAEAPYWNLFVEMLALFKSHSVNLIVNEMEEAPYVYGTQEAKERFRSFMREKVEPQVRQFGFPYVRVDFEKLTDVDYFDYNHLNSRGAQAFIPMLATKLAPNIRANNGKRPSSNELKSTPL